MRRLFPTEEAASQSEELLRLLLRHLPKPKEQIKIIKRMVLLAEEHGVEIGKFKWWDIQAGRVHALTAVLKRDAKSVRVQFLWKGVRKGQTMEDVDGALTAVVVPTPNDPCDYLVDFEAGYYRNMLAAYNAWLQSPFP